MLYQIAHFLRDKCPFVWDAVGAVNSAAFGVRYGSAMRRIEDCCRKYSDDEVVFSEVKKGDGVKLSGFLTRQPEEAFEFFHPHDFDARSIEKLIRDRSFIMVVARKGEIIVGYAFMRSFVNGKSFRGKIVDVECRGRGIAKKFGLLTTDIAVALGINLFGTISKANMASMASSKSVNEIRVIEELPDDYVLIQYLPKNHQ